MKQFTVQVAGEPVTINVYQEGDSLAPFAEFITREDYVGFDTETSGGSVWDAGWHPRLAQFGSATEAHVLPASMERPIKAALGAARMLVMHSAPADCITAARGWGMDPEPLARKTYDTLVMSRLIDPMGHSLRNNGRLESLHGLKDRVRQLVDPEYVAMEQLKAAARKQKCAWWSVDANTPEYLTYSGLDPILTVRLAETLRYLGTSPLEDREHRIMVECMLMSWRGMKTDQNYRADLELQMLEEARISLENARACGFPADDIATKDDKAKVATWLRASGVELPSTAKGADSLAKDALYEAAAGNETEPVLKAFYHNRELKKWVRDYLSKMQSDRVHPNINSIGAITGRQSVSDPPFHQLPPAVRGVIVPDDGLLLGAVDLDRIEFVVAAGLSQDARMMQAIMDGEDLHGLTAARLFGDSYSPEQRGYAKVAGLGRMYGAGKRALAVQCGIPEDLAERFIASFDSNFPAVRQLGRRLGELDWVETAWGRQIPADPIRKYGNLNYAIQSSARDVFVDWMMECIQAGVQVLLPLHDELIFQGSCDAIETVVSCLKKDFMGVPLTAEGKMMERWAKV